ncbi:DUF447 domain-containing protein [Methanobrevibacter sp.]|uniref:DUF447 domain-containing protein n=1 Tax=Methanobrevibacter sp. TaxID=66852 RepID=UPI00388D4CD5
MKIDLSLIGMEKGRQYETIITTKNCDNTYNAAPIGVICSAPDRIVNRIFKGSHTLDNIIREREFIVNITHDVEVFTISTIENLPQDYFGDGGTLKCGDAFFKCEVISLKEAVKQSDPIKKKDEAIVIKAQVTELVIKNNTKAFNRGFSYVVETLANFTRFDLADDNKKEDYINKFREAYRVTRKVGTADDKKAMTIIKKELENRGYEP